MLIACDGSSFKNGVAETPIGWAWAREDGAWMSNGMVGGTNNRAELHGILSILALHPHDDLTVLMDSQYALNVVEKWSFGWEKNGWIKRDDTPVQNADLVKLILKFRKMREAPIVFQWVKAHKKDTHALNVRADELAGAAMRRAKEGILLPNGMTYSDSKDRDTVLAEERIFERLYGKKP